MSNISNTLYNMHALDEHADTKTMLHSIHPVSKLLVTMVFLLVVVSFHKYDLSGLLPLVFYPLVVSSLGDVPFRLLFKPMLLTAPLLVGIGIFNPILDQSIAVVFCSVSISGGWLSFLSILLKGGLTILAALLLLATTGMDRIAFALRMLYVPRLFVLQLLLTYRYIYVLLEEFGRIWNGYLLRAPGQQGVGWQVWGSLTGNMLLRSMDRAQRVYEAMRLRGFEGEYHPGGTRPLTLADIGYMAGWVLFFTTARYYNLPALLGQLVTGGIS